jgi:transcriptional regulator with XRE-family HTH domain
LASVLEGTGKVREMRKQNKDINTTTMGGRIQYLRLQKDWSQEELAFKIGVNKKSVVSEYENDKRAVTLSILPLMAEELGTTIDYLVRGSAAEEEDPDLVLAMQLLKSLKSEKGRKAAIEHIKLVAMMEQ